MTFYSRVDPFANVSFYRPLWSTYAVSVMPLVWVDLRKRAALQTIDSPREHW